MKAKSTKAKKEATAPAGLQLQLPAMDDKALANLSANARRLESSGSAAQREAATALLPAIDAELSARRAVAAAALDAAKIARRERLAAGRARKTKPTAVKAS